MHSSSISIWFFVGILLTVYGALILGYGLYELTLPQMAVANYHASIWWGGIMLLLGLLYSIKFRPGKAV